MRRTVAVLFALSSWAACGPGAPSHNGSDAGPNDTCSGSETRCLGQDFQTCNGSHYQTTQTCTSFCDNSKGCLDCDPNGGNTCNGAAVVTCNSDGSFGTVVETCPTGEGCQAGMCSRVCTADGVDLIYVVDQQNELLSFDPRLLSGGASAAFKKIGTLACPAGPSWSDWAAGQPGPATPFSMGVDRNAVAWVLYTSGEIFKVSTANASCIGNSGYQQGPDGNPQNGMEVFGMGFVTDVAGGNTEKLYIGGGDISATPGSGHMAVIDPANPATATVIGAVPAPSGPMYSPELTGTGAAQMFGFFPGDTDAFVQELSKTDGSLVNPTQQWTIPGGLGAG